MLRSILNPLMLLALAVVVSGSDATPSVTVLARGPLLDLAGAPVGEARIEVQGGRRLLHLTGAGRLAGPNLDLLLSTARRPLRQGDHGGPGRDAVRVGPLDRPEVRLPLDGRFRLRRFQTVWLWCASVRLPAARAVLHWRPR